MVPSADRGQRAISSVSTICSERMWSVIALPTKRLLYASITAQFHELCVLRTHQALFTDSIDVLDAYRPPKARLGLPRVLGDLAYRVP